jgi:hypothetical protein
MFLSDRSKPANLMEAKQHHWTLGGKVQNLSHFCSYPRRLLTKNRKWLNECVKCSFIFGRSNSRASRLLNRPSGAGEASSG